MPKLASRDKHVCCTCSKVYGDRRDFKKHLTLPALTGKPRCSGLKKVIPSDVWVKQILPYYAQDAPLPDLGNFKRGKVGPYGGAVMLLEPLHGWLFAYGDVAIAQHREYNEIKKKEIPTRLKYLFRGFKNKKRKARIGVPRN